MSGVSDPVRQQRRAGRAFPRAPTSSNHCKSLLLFQELETTAKILIFFISFPPVLQRVFSSHAPLQYLQRSGSSTHSSRFQTTHMSRVWLLHRAVALSDAPEPDLFALFTTYWIQVRRCSVLVQRREEKVPIAGESTEVKSTVSLCYSSSDVTVAWWCLEDSTQSSLTSNRLIVTCSTNAPAAPWPSSPLPASRAISPPNIQHSQTDRPRMCLRSAEDTVYFDEC